MIFFYLVLQTFYLRFILQNIQVVKPKLNVIEFLSLILDLSYFIKMVAILIK